MKPGTFTQMYVQLVFAVKNRDAALKEEFRKRAFNLNEVCCRMYNCFYNTWSPTGYSSFINIADLKSAIWNYEQSFEPFN